MAKKTLEQLQEDHSEMLATAADLGVTVPADMTVDFATVEVGATVCSNLDALIRNFRAGVDAEDEENEIDGTDADEEEDEGVEGGDDDGDSDEDEEEDGDDVVDDEDEVKVLAKNTDRGKDASEGKKSGGKKPSKKPTTKQNGEDLVADNVNTDKEKAAAAKAKEKAAAAKLKEREKAAAAKAKAAAAKLKEREKAAAAKAKAAAAKAKEKEKAAAAKAKGGEAKVRASRGNGLDEAATITWGGKENPARGGRAERIAQVIKFSGKTVKAYIAAGGNPTTLKNCVAAKLCTVV